MGLEIPLAAVRRQIASGIDIIVHLGRLRDKSRRVLQILEILGYDSRSGEVQTQVLYEFEEEGEDACGNITGKLIKRRELMQRQKLQRAGLLLLPGVVLFFRERREALQKRRAVEMKRQFMDGMQLLTVSLQAGYSVENSVREAVKELRRVYEPEAFIVREFQIMEAQLTVNRNMEELFMDFGERSAVDDIQSFAEVFLTAKRSGGDLIAVIRNTVFCIRQKQETLHEIETSLAGKVMEQNVMSMIPLFILAYVKFTSPDFLGVMYGNLTGVTIMVLCFLVYVLAYFWGRNIVQIEV